MGGKEGLIAFNPRALRRQSMEQLSIGLGLGSGSSCQVPCGREWNWRQDDIWMCRSGAANKSPNHLVLLQTQSSPGNSGWLSSAPALSFIA